MGTPAHTGLLQGRTALVTGAGQGNGRALAIGLAQAGARVVCTDVNAATVAETAALIGSAARHQVLDVTDFAACQSLAASLAADGWAIDLLVNNAGILIREGSDSPNAAANFERVMRVNVQGTFNVTQSLLAQLKAARGHVVNIASIAAFAGQGSIGGYAPSKGAIKLYTQSLAQELAPFGVRVNALAPGVIDTPMTTVTRSAPEKLERFMSRIPLGRVGQPADLVGPVVFLCSALSEYVTGVTLPVDGGFLAV
jgi:NAD(P)-dependent dehydrogenase (short-subunit alcohol dehydrogenase family)